MEDIKVTEVRVSVTVKASESYQSADATAEFKATVKPGEDPERVWWALYARAEQIAQHAAAEALKNRLDY